MTEAFCDWLDVTHPVGFAPIADLELLLLSVGAEVLPSGAFRVGDGVALVERRPRFVRLSFSGGVLAYLRDAGRFLSLLGLLGSVPHRVTRLDAAVDVPRDGPEVVAELRGWYPEGRVRLGRKALPVKLLLEVRDDGKETGTFYVGHRTAARATARVYDKAWERLSKAGIDGPPRTRYEVTVRKDYGATLRDAAEPDRLFWHVASPALLDAPEGIEPWTHGWAEGWHADVPDDLLPAEVLSRRVERSPELELLLSVAERVGPNGRILLARRILQRLGVESGGLTLSASALGVPETVDQ